MSQPFTSPSSKIFISYRRDDAAGHAGRLFDRLSAHFGADQIFMDIEQIEAGADFVQAIQEAVGSCEILIALIGRHWLSGENEAERRIDNPNDFVRLEVATALERDVRVIPVLVQGAAMPRPQDLPADLVLLSRRNAIELSNTRWKHDVDGLIATVEKVLARQRGATPAAATGGQAAEEAKQQQQRAAEDRQRQIAAAAAATERAAAAAGRSELPVRGEAVMPLFGTPATDKPAPSRFIRRVVIAAAAALAVIVVGIIVIAALVSALPSGSESGENQLTQQTPTPKSKPTNLVAQQTGEVTGSPTPPPSPPAPGEVIQNQSGMKFVWVPKGSFMMGSENGDPDEQPVHEVTLSDGFYMGKYEVTQAQWQKVMGSNPSYFQGCDNCPVESVSWDNVQEFISKLTELNDGYTYRLPTEAEWEYAARAGTKGDYAGDLDVLAWYGDNSGQTPLDAAELLSTTDKEDYFRLLKENGCQTHPVGKKQKNAFGLFDMYGNVWELCQDWYHDSYKDAPPAGSAWLSGGEQKNRVLRGGSWTNGADLCRSAKRNQSPLVKPSFSYGLRLVAVTRT